MPLTAPGQQLPIERMALVVALHPVRSQRMATGLRRPLIRGLFPH